MVENISGLRRRIHPQNHNDAVRKRQAKTAEWFTRCKEFADWRLTSNSFLWLHGIRELQSSVELGRLLTSNYNWMWENFLMVRFSLAFDLNENI